MIPIIKKEFGDKKISLLVYCLLIFGMIWMYIALFPSIQAQAASLSKLFDSLGPAVKAFGVNSLGFDTLEKYLSIELFGITWPLLMITLVVGRAGQAIAGETEKGTLGTVLALPVSRANIYLAKYFAGFFALLLLVAITTFTPLLIAPAYGISFHPEHFLNLGVLCLLFGWALYSLAMLFSVLLNEKGHVYLAMGGVLMAMYVGNVVAGITNDWQWLQYVSLFHYFNASEVLISNQVNLYSFAVFGGLIIISTFCGMAWLMHKDIVV